MNIELIKGAFSQQDACELILKMIDAKIKFHERKIDCATNEEDIKMRESRIKQLQKEVYEIRKSIEKHGDRVQLKAHIEIN